MFGFLKDKFKKAISKFTNDVKEEVEEKVLEERTEKIQKVEKSHVSEVKEKFVKDSKKEKQIDEKKVDKDKSELKDHHTKPEVKKQVEKQVEEEKKQESKSNVKPVEKIKHVEKKPRISDFKKDKVLDEIKAPISHVKKAENVIVEEKKQEVKDSKKHVSVHKHEPVHNHATVELKKEELVKEEYESLPKEEKKGFFNKLFSKKDAKEQIREKEHEEKELVDEEKPIEKKGFFDKITEVVTKKTLSSDKFDELFFELEVSMLENNVALEVIDKIKSDLKKSLLSEKVSRVKTDEIIAESLKNSIDELFDVEKIDLLSLAKKKKPFVICFVGVNGSGKTTNLAKLANYLQKNGLSVVIAACDTFRAAAIQQIEEHAKNLDIKLIKHDYGADAAAVAYDAIEHAKAKGKDVVLIDTAGRSHSNVNLMEELDKVVRVSKPDMKIFVGDSLTGNDAVDQAKTFNEKVGIDGIILSKVDVDEKGGAAISVSYVTKKPILFIGTGQTYDDFEEFDKEKIMENLGF